MIVPEPQPALGIDGDTAEIFPENTLFRISSADDVDGLAEAILGLHRNPAERHARGRATLEIAEDKIHSWRRRINTEIELLENLAVNATRKSEAHL